MLQQFLAESKQTYNTDSFVRSTICNIDLGIQKKALHDTWISNQAYCLCKEERDADGSRVYTAYQLWIAPASRSLRNVRRIIRFLRFYAQKQGFKRLYILSSRLDNIKAYSRGLGKQFKIKTITFSQDF